MSKVKQPNPISEGWVAYRKLVDEELKKKSRNTYDGHLATRKMFNT